MYIEYKPGEKFAGKNADTSDRHEAFRDCGYLLADDDLVVDIDCLGKEHLETLIDSFEIKTQTVWTDRGVHLYFKKPEGRKSFRNGVCQLGFKVELLDKTKRPNGVTIKRNGVLRTIENEGLRAPLPDLFKVNPKYQNLLGMDEGEGRNEALHAHKLKLKNCEQWLQILSYINMHVFATPLPTAEFQTVTRQESTSDDDKEAPEVTIADALIHTRRTVKWAGQLWFWDPESRSYISDTDDQLLDVICKACEGKRTGFIDEVKKQIDYRSAKHPKDEVFCIKLKNGFLSKGKFIPMNYDEFTPYSIDIDYDPNAEAVPLIDDYLKQLAQAEGYGQKDTEDYRTLLLEVLAFGLITDPAMTRDLAKFFIFRGDGANGKGTLLEILRRIYQPQNCSSLSIEQMEDDRYVSAMVGKLMNLGDDIEDAPITKKQMKKIKNFTSADTVTSRRLYSDAVNVIIQAKMIFTSNADIRTFDKGFAVERRFCWMPMFNHVTKPDPRFLSKVTTPEALRYWMRLIVEAYERLYQNGWTDSKISADYNEQYHRHNDLTLMFLDEIDFEQIHYKGIKEIEKIFDEWNTEDDRKFPKKLFRQNVWRKYQAGFGSKKINGNAVKCLLLSSETTQKLKPTFK